MENISYLGVFLEGLLSFMSPCILPLIPLYMSYLTSFSSEDKGLKHTFKLFLITLCFVLGISTVYFILGLSVSFVREFIVDYQNIITLVGGIILIFFALSQFGLISIKGLNTEHSFKDKLDISAMNYFKAYLLGFIFSFAWSPCIGPMMANVLILAASSSAAIGNMLIVFYVLGFTIPFLLLALFYDFLIKFIKDKKDILLKISKVAAIIILLFGFGMFIDGTNKIVKVQKDYQTLLASNNTNNSSNSDKFMMYDFNLKDQFGNIHTLSDYKGKYIALNFIASWCNYCINEIDDYKAFYDEVDDDVVVLYVMADSINAQNSNLTTEEFIEEYNVEVPVLYDDTTMFNYLGVNSFPTVVYIGPDGSYIGYQSGAMDLDMLLEVMSLAKEKYTGGN